MDKNQDREIAFSNRYLYYYASLLRKLYGFVVRRGEEAPDERYIGQLGEQPERRDIPPDFVPPDALKPRKAGDPAVGEIVLFRYRKRLLLGYCRHVLDRAVSEITVQTEDHRRLRFHRTNLIYLTGVSVDKDPALLHPYAASVRKLSAEIDLHAVWDLAAGSQTPLMQSDIADLYWGGDIDATRWTALYMHLDGACPYFTSQGEDAFVPVSSTEAEARSRALKRRQQRREERDEFVLWMNDAEDTDIDTLTQTQRTWLDAICQFALWGQESERASLARELLSEICPGRKDIKRAAFEQVVAKGLWEADQNLDLLRAEIPIEFSEDAILEAQTLDVSGSLKTRRKLRQQLFVIRDPDLPEIALSFRRPLFGGPEFGVHIPDLGSFIAPASALDEAAADRMITHVLPDQKLPMMPPELNQKVQFQMGVPHPTLSLLWRMDHKGRLKNFALNASQATVQTELTCDEIERARHNTSHSHNRAVRFFNALIDRLADARSPGDPKIDPPDLHVQLRDGSLKIAPKPNELAHRIVAELEILSSVAVGRWCAEQNVPAIYEMRDPIENLDALQSIEHPVVRRHEMQYFTPKVRYDSRPDFHHGWGVATCCPIARPTDRYTDLLMHRQIIHTLRRGQPFYKAEQLDILRFRMQEAHAQTEGLTYRRQRDLLLRDWADQTGREFCAVVLHIKRQGVLIELLDAPFKTVVFPGQPVEVGDELTLRLTGVDLWLSRAHFTVQQTEFPIRP